MKVNFTPNNKQATFGSLNTGGKFFFEEEQAVLKPIKEFSKNKFEDFGEIHVQLIKPQKQEGFFQGLQQYFHDYEISISPMGLKNGTPDYNYRVVAYDLSSLGDNLKKSLDEILSNITKAYKAFNKNTPEEGSIKNLQKAMDVTSYSDSNEIFFA